MQRNSTNYVLLFTVAMTAIVAVVLAGMYSSLKEVHTTNELNYNKKQILSSLNQAEGFKAEKLADSEVAGIFENQVTSVVIDANGRVVEGKNAEDIDMEKEEKKPEADRLYPVFAYTSKESNEKYYILTIRGNGLWDKIWGWIAVKNDSDRTVAGASFGHKSETPGLGAEIADNSGWKAKFAGKKLYENGSYKSVVVKKGGATQANLDYEVDGISGATVTSDGVTEMLQRGLQVYMMYLDTVSAEKGK